MKLEVKSLSKRYQENNVLSDISFTINGGEIFCLLGKNGAGKSTLINILTNLLDNDKGEILYNGIPISDKKSTIKKHIGLQSQYEQLIQELNVFDYLDLIGTIYEMNKSDIKNRSGYLIDYFFEVSELHSLNKSMTEYSTGMKKKAMLCATLLHKPEIIFFDEPFSNLDPVTCNKLCKLLKSYSNEGRIIFISSHDLLYVQNLASRIVILSDQQIVFDEETINIPFSEKNKLENIFLDYMKIDEIQDNVLINEIK